MSAVVETGYRRDIVIPEADEYVIDNGHLILVTSRCGQVAAFAAGEWLSVKITRNRDRHGRFVKKGN